LPVIILKQAVHMIFWKQKRVTWGNASFVWWCWQFDLEFLVDVTNHLNHLKMKLQGKNDFFLTFVSDGKCVPAVRVGRQFDSWSGLTKTF